MVNNTLFDALFIKIEEQIKAGIYKEGDKLPSERALSVEHDISRNIVRQVLAALREKGLIKIVPGKGAYVTPFDNDKLTETLQLVIDNSDSTMRDLLETREILERVTIIKAVSRRTNKDIEELKYLCWQMDEEVSLANFLDMDLKFHKKLADATQNKIFSTLVHSFYDITDQFPFMVTKYTNNVLQVTEKAQKEHKQLITALEHRDKDAAMKIMKEHMKSFKKEVEFYESKNKKK